VLYTNVDGGAGKGSEANDAALHGASGTLRGLLKVNSLYWSSRLGVG